MKVSQVNQNLRPTKFYELKQLQYFKQIIRKTEDIHLKQFLPLHVYKLATKSLDHQNYVYIPDKCIDQLANGVPIDNNVNQLSKKTTLYRVSRKLDKILRQVLVLNIPVISNLNGNDRFTIFNSISLQTYAFNRTIHRKGQKIRGIYFIIEGQIKIFSQKSGNSVRIIKQKNFIGLNELYQESQYYYQTILSNFNNTQLLLINLQTLNETIQNSDTTLKQLFNSYYANQQGQIKTNSRIKRPCKRKSQDKKVSKIPIKLNNFVKKCDQFMNITTRDDNGFNDYLKSKKILLQLRQTMSAAKLNKKNRKERFNRPIMIGQTRKTSGIYSNLSSCRSKILKQQILKRLSYNKNFTEIQINKPFTESINILSLFKEIR